MTAIALKPSVEPANRLVTLRRALRNGGFGRPTRLLEQKVEAPQTGEDRTAQELAVAKAVFDTLEAAYPGHFWFVDCDLAKGGVCIAIPILMGGNWVFFIRLPDLNDRMVVMAGGEVLERYRLARGGMRPDQFVDARDKHSILAGRSKKVPT
jgi:hypothetical protein